MPSAQKSTATDPTPALLGLAVVAAILPFWVTSIIPATDLPQHLAQMHLLDRTLAGIEPDLRVTPWYYPNTLVCWLLYLFWQIADPIAAGRLIMSTLAGAWLGATWLMCRAHGRPLGSWFIATPLVFNFLFAWGLLNFLVGWPLFCLFVSIAGRNQQQHRALKLGFTSLLLYFAHALWFAMASAWFLALLAASHRENKQAVKSAAALLPGWFLASIWYPGLAASRQASGVGTGLTWGRMPIERLDFSDITNATLGATYSELETIFVAISFCWIVVAIATQWKTIDEKSDKPILLAAITLLLAYWMFPSVYMNTIFFNDRWLPCGMTMLALALPAPVIRRKYLIAFGACTLIAFSATTIVQWREWESEQLDGFMETLVEINASDRVLAINLIDGGDGVKGRPGLQLFAYAQALKGADIFFTFTEHYSGAVQFKVPPPPNTARQLVWAPISVTQSQASGFSKIIINTNDTLHTHFMRRLKLEQIGTSQTTWRIYRPVKL
jgi:hypothetical protein